MPGEIFCYLVCKDEEIFIRGKIRKYLMEILQIVQIVGKPLAVLKQLFRSHNVPALGGGRGRYCAERKKYLTVVGRSGDIWITVFFLCRDPYLDLCSLTGLTGIGKSIALAIEDFQSPVRIIDGNICSS